MCPAQKVHASLAWDHSGFLRVFEALDIFLRNLEAEDSIRITLRETRQHWHCNTD